MSELEYGKGDIAYLKKPHPCGSHQWQIERLGADIRLKCLGCKRQVMLSRSEFERRLQKVSAAFEE